MVINSLLPVQRNSDGLLEHLGKHHKDVALKKKEKDLAEKDMVSATSTRYALFQEIADP